MPSSGRLLLPMSGRQWKAAGLRRGGFPTWAWSGLSLANLAAREATR